jgi:hypothetical protein
MASVNLVPGHGFQVVTGTGTNLVPGHGVVKETATPAAPPGGPIVTMIGVP